MGGIHSGGYSGPTISDSGASGYLDIGTVRIQWLTVVSTLDGVEVFNLPASFLNTNYVVMTNPDTNFTTVGAIGPWRLAGKTTSTFTLDRDNDVQGTPSVDVMAIGRKP